jgi:hypothetical protein
MIDDTALKDIAAHQHGAVSVEQAIEAGFSAGSRQRLVDDQRWRRGASRVLVLRGTPATPGQVASIAVLSAGRTGAALSGSSSAAWWGIPGNLLEPMQVLRERDRSVRSPMQAAVHEPKLLLSHHVVTLDSVRTVIPARALIEVAGSRRGGAQLDWWVRRMERMVDSAWAMRLVSGASLHQTFEEMAQRGRSGIAVMRLVLANRGVDYIPPASGLESRVVQILERAGELPLRRQIDTGDGRWIGRVDFRDPHLPFILEVQSERFHASLIDQQLDGDRLGMMSSAGFVVREVTDVDVWQRPQHVVDVVRQGRLLARARRHAA